MALTDISIFFCPTRIYMGAGSHRKVADLVRARDCKRLFIAIDAALLGSDFYKDVTALLAEQGVAVATYSDIEPDPSAHTVARAFEVCRAHEATMSLAIGGGSTMDVAKAVGILATNGGRIHDDEGIEKFSGPALPLIAIPTTAGTGSEVSGSGVITDTDLNLKMSIRHAALLGNVHCMARFVGTYFHVSHGLSNAVCLPHVARFNLSANPTKFARIAAAMGRPVQGLPELDAARQAIDAIEMLCNDLAIPPRLRDIGATEASFDEMAELCTAANYNRWNPRHTTTADFRALFDRAF